MKRIHALIVMLLMVLTSMPTPVRAQQASEVFAMPDAVAGGFYQVSIETVLREKYQLALQAEARESMFRWSFAGGAIPAGLVVRPNGNIVGTPRIASDQPYRFQVKVREMTYPGSAVLTLDLTLTIGARRIRLVQVQAPRLVPINAATMAADEGNRGLANHSANLKPNDYVALDVSTFTKPTTSANASRSAVNGDAPSSMPVHPPNRTDETNSRGASVETFHDANLIRPLLSRMKIKPPESIQRMLSSDKDIEVDVARESASGDKIRGPAKIKLKNLNPLRYENRVGKNVTFPPALDLTLPFIPPVAGQPQKSTPGEQVRAAGFVVAPATCPSVTYCFADFIGRLNVIEGAKTSSVNDRIAIVSQLVNYASANLVALVSASDAILNSGGGAQAVIDGLTPLIGTAAAPGGSVDAALVASVVWPDAAIEQLLGELNVLKNDVISLPTVQISGGATFHNWYQVPTNKAAYDGVRARIDELQTQLNGLKNSSPQGLAFQAAQDKLRLWKPILVGVRNGGVAGFSTDYEEGCSFAFNTGKEAKIKLIKRDRLASPGTPATEEEIVTVVCSSPLSISAGFGFSNVDEREFVFVPSTKTVTTNGQATQTVISRFGFRSKSGVRTLPVVLLNTRVWEPTDTFALHLSTGAAVDIKTGQGGTDLEYIVGPSISFWRSLFITTGLHMGRVNKLAGGFELDQEVPTGINEPPIEKSWKKGFVTTLTYKIK